VRLDVSFEAVLVIVLFISIAAVYWAAIRFLRTLREP